MSNLFSLIGSTPLVKVDSFSNKSVNLFAKLEGKNVGGSIKDRVALAMIEDLEKRGVLTKDKIIIEPSSGNTGIGLAMIGAAKGYKVKIIMPETATQERIKLLKMYGAEVQLCKKTEWKSNVAIENVKKFVSQHPEYIMPNQYENPVCVDIHYKTTAAEIISQCPSITHLVATIGTGGTITGIAKRLKKYNGAIQIVGVEIGSDSKIPGPRNLHSYVPPIIDFNFIDKRVMIENEEEVFAVHKQLAMQEGIFAGISSAAALSVAMKISVELDKANIVIIFPDGGDRYMSILS